MQMAGTKVVGHAYWKETGDSLFEGIAQDFLIMNIDDLLCVEICCHLL